MKKNDIIGFITSILFIYSSSAYHNPLLNIDLSNLLTNLIQLNKYSEVITR